MAFRIALAQADSRLGELEANLARAHELVGEARAAKAELVVFPELFLSGYALDRATGDTALDPGSPELAGLAQAGLSVAIGFHERDSGGPSYNSSAYLADGRVVALQRKLHLPGYGPWSEPERFSPGPSIRAFDTAFGRAAIVICNDLWHPVVPFLAAQDGAELLIVPANSGLHADARRLDLETTWRDLTRVTARMFECYVVFVNRVGVEHGFAFWGGSHVVDPEGTTVLETGPEETLAAAELDLEHVRRRRRDLPLLAEARLDLVRAEVDRLLSRP